MIPTWWWTPCSPSSMPPNRLDGWSSGLSRLPNSAGVVFNWTRDIAGEWPRSQPNAEPSVVVMTTNIALDKKRLPEHTQRLDWMTIAPATPAQIHHAVTTVLSSVPVRSWDRHERMS